MQANRNKEQKNRANDEYMRFTYKKGETSISKVTYWRFLIPWQTDREKKSFQFQKIKLEKSIVKKQLHHFQIKVDMLRIEDAPLIKRTKSGYNTDANCS